MPKARARSTTPRREAVAAVRGLQARGVRSIDVGCMQVNLMHHPDAFPSLDVAFDPQANAAYAARFLKELYAQTGDWTRATAAVSLGDSGYRRRLSAQGAGGLAGGIASGKQCPGFTPGAGLGSDDVRGSPWLHAGSAISIARRHRRAAVDDVADRGGCDATRAEPGCLSRRTDQACVSATAAPYRRITSASELSTDHGRILANGGHRPQRA